MKPFVRPANATPKTVAEELSKAIAKPSTVALVKTEPEEWTWTPERERALDMLLSGLPKTQIAKELGVSRRTIIRWSQTSEFISEYQSRMADHVATTRQRRIRQTNIFGDRVERMAANALKAAESDPLNPAKAMHARSWLSEFRSWRDQERQDFGDNIQRYDVRGAVGVVGQIQHHVHGNASFKQFLEQSIKDGVIDAELINTSDPGQMVADLTQQAIIDTDIMDQLHEEDLADASSDED